MTLTGSVRSEAGPLHRPEAGTERWWLWWRLGIGLGLLTALLIVAGPRQVVALAGEIHPGWALATLGLSLVWLCMGALNVWILLRRLAPVPLTHFTSVWVTSWTLSLIVPGQLGDASQVVLLRRWRIEVGRSGAAYLVDKAVSLGWMLMVASWAALLFVPNARGWWFLAAPGAVLALLAAGRYVIRRLPDDSDGPLGRVRRFVTTLGTHVGSFRKWPGTLALNAGLTLVKWVIMAGIYLWAFRAFGATVTPVAAATIPVVASLIGYLPITVGGAGTMEWTATALFGGLGLEASTVLVVYLFIRVVLMASALLLLVVSSGRSSTVEGSSVS